MHGDVLLDRGNKFRHAAKYTTAQTLGGALQIQPRRRLKEALQVQVLAIKSQIVRMSASARFGYMGRHSILEAASVATGRFSGQEDAVLRYMGNSEISG